MPSRFARWLIALLLSYALGCGGAQGAVKPPEPLQSPQVLPLPRVDTFTLRVGEEPITLEAPTTMLVQIMFLGAGSEPVSLSAGKLPTFMQLSGTVVRISPGHGDVGEHEIPLIATSGGKTATATLRLHITRPNTPPHWLPMPMLNDRFGMDTSYPPVPGKAVLMVTACDKEGDDITLEAEVVPRGQPRSGVPTHTKVTSFKKVRRLPYYQDTFCAKIELPLSGLATSVPYDIAYRVFDSQGADGSESSGGFTIEP